MSRIAINFIQIKLPLEANDFLLVFSGFINDLGLAILRASLCLFPRGFAWTSLSSNDAIPFSYVAWQVRLIEKGNGTFYERKLPINFKDGNQL